jgi:hypothetical protein
MDPRFEHQSLSIHEQLTLSAFHLLGGVEAALSVPPTPVVLAD